MFHKPAEYDKLTQTQKRELSEWRKSTKSGGDGNASSRKRTKLVATINKQLSKKIAEKETEQSSKKEDDAKAKAYIMSLFENQSPSIPNATRTVASTTAAAMPPTSSSNKNLI